MSDHVGRAEQLLLDLVQRVGDPSGCSSVLTREMRREDGALVLALVLRETFGERMRPDTDRPGIYRV